MKCRWRSPHCFPDQAEDYQAVSTRVAALHDQFVQAVNTGAGAYLTIEIANVQQNLNDAVNAPTLAMLGRPLICNGADGSTIDGVGQPGGAGGLLCGDRGNGGATTKPGLAGNGAVGVNGGTGGVGGGSLAPIPAARSGSL